MSFARHWIAGLIAAGTFGTTAAGAENVMITGVPDYSWYVGCFGTASGNMMGYWDRHGFENFYTGPTGGGVAPLNTVGENRGVRSMWASWAGFDGRPADQPGHIDDYWTYFINDSAYSYESPAADPYTIAGRTEHEPDSICDFMGASQNKWSDFDGECRGNIDAYAFNFWDKQGEKRENFVPSDLNGQEVRDIQSGLVAWTKYRESEAEVFSQLADFNPEVPLGKGFTFEDLKREIDAGYPVMLFLQKPGDYNRTVEGVAGVNPIVHALVAYGYVVEDSGRQIVRFRTSWATGDTSPDNFSEWGPWSMVNASDLPMRGVIGYRPLPKIKSITPEPGKMTVKWEGPASEVRDNIMGSSAPVHWYVIEKSPSLNNPNFQQVTEPSPELQVTFSDSAGSQGFYRVRLLSREEAGM